MTTGQGWGIDSFWVYVLRSKKDQTSYIGSTKNLEKRLKEHNSGKSISTRSKRPWELAHCETFKTRSEAVKKEKFYKSIVGRIESRKKGIIS